MLPVKSSCQLGWVARPGILRLTLLVRRRLGASALSAFAMTAGSRNGASQRASWPFPLPRLVSRRSGMRSGHCGYCLASKLSLKPVRHRLASVSARLRRQTAPCYGGVAGPVTTTEKSPTCDASFRKPAGSSSWAQLRTWPLLASMSIGFAIPAMRTSQWVR